MTVILYNPMANNHTGEAHAREWVAAHQENPDNLKNVFDIPDLGGFIGAFDENDKVIMLGGDGTLTHLADSIRNVELRVPVYFAPAGTGNDFIADIRDSHPEDPVLINEYITNLPIVRVNGEEHVFVNAIGYGLDGYCCEVGDEKQRKSPKPVNYSAIAIGGLLGGFTPRNATIIVDGVEKQYKKVWLAPVMNGRQYGGGIKVAPSQDRLNPAGTVSSAVIYNGSRLGTLMKFPKITKGEHVNMTKIFDIREGHEITVRFDTPCALQIDGETYLNVSEYTVLSRRAANPAAFPSEETAEEAVPV